MLCASLDGRAVWGEWTYCICLAKALHSSPETTTTLVLQYKIKCLKLKTKYSSTSLRFKPNTIGIDVNSMTLAFG